MPLFVVQAKHAAESCPAGDPQMGPMLVSHVSKENAAKAGVTLHSDAIIDGGHTIYLIVDADSEEPIRQFMTPFAQMGTVEIWPSSSCERVVARGKC